MSDNEKTGKGMSLEDQERDIASQKPAPEPKPAPKPNAAPPPPVTVRRGGSGLLGGTALLLALGALALSGYGFWRDQSAPLPVAPAATDLAPLSARVAAVEAQQQELVDALAALTARQDALEGRPPADRAATPAPPPPTAPDDIVRPEPALGDIVDRVAALEQRPAADAVDLSPLTHRVQTLEEVTAEVIPRVTMLETRRQMGAVGEALIIAVGQLQAALSAGRPYARELRAAQALAANDSALLDLLAPLVPTADQGLASDVTLREQFRLLAPAVLRADRDREGAHWTDRVLGRLTSVITLRRASGDVAGDHADAVLARAEADLLAGNLPGAVQEMEALPAHAAAPVAGWLEQAQARMAAEAAAATLADLSLARMTGTGAGPKDGEAH